MKTENQEIWNLNKTDLNWTKYKFLYLAPLVV